MVRYNNVVLEIDLAAFTVFHHAAIEYLIEQFEHVGMGLFDLVQEHDGIGTPPHRFGEHSTFAVSHISGRRTLQGGDGMRFLKFRHVDGDQVVLAAVEKIRQGQRCFGLAHAAGTHQHEYSDRLVGIIQTGSRCLNPLADDLQSVALADHPVAQHLLQGENRIDLILHHLADRDSGPGGDDFTDNLGVDTDPDQTSFTLQLRKLAFKMRKLSA